MGEAGKTFQEIVRDSKGQKEILIVGDNSPVCPQCGNNNAMLGRMTSIQGKMTCRDCGFTIRPTDGYVVRCFSLEKGGMGSRSTYIENY